MGKCQLKKVSISFFIVLPAIMILSFHLIKRNIPETIKIVVGEEETLNFGLPINGVFQKAIKIQENKSEQESVKEVNTNTTEKLNPYKIHLNLSKVKVKSNKVGCYSMVCNLFGILPLKEVNLEFVESKKVIPCGIPIGIYVETSGVLVIGTGKIHGIDGIEYEPGKNIVKSGDYIESVNKEAVKDKNDLISKINHNGKKEVILGIRRQGEEIYVRVKPVEVEASKYQLGIWVRDDTQGIGTLTYIDEANRFGALGHGINDVDTSLLMEIQDGTLYNAQITSIVKGENGSPGELAGTILYQNAMVVGNIIKNTSKGIYGCVRSMPEELKSAKKLEVAYKQDIKLGKAIIRCAVNGVIRDYEIEIIHINHSEENTSKGIEFKVTDPELIKETGGIVQGMSGSPIMQNGKIIGAVTHVFVQDSQKGFGIFIENMLEETQSLK